jgi:hypothetical protein
VGYPKVKAKPVGHVADARLNRHWVQIPRGDLHPSDIAGRPGSWRARARVMVWERVALAVPAAFSVLSLMLTQTAGLLAKAADVVRAWHDLRRDIGANKRKH